jgi:hypothetical protein
MKQALRAQFQPLEIVGFIALSDSEIKTYHPTPCRRAQQSCMYLVNGYGNLLARLA